MANRLEISDEEWRVIYPILIAHREVRLASEVKCRTFLTAVLWVLRSGSQWRLLPREQSRWNSVFKRFSRWGRRGVFEALHMGCAQYPDLQSVFIDSTIIRAHPCAAGMAGSDAEAEALGRSWDGFGTKIHALTDALGNPLGFTLTGRQASDIGQAGTLLELTPEGAEALVADKGYDSDKFIEVVLARGMAVVIPPRKNRKEPRTYDGFIYKERHLIECFFNKSNITEEFSPATRKPRATIGGS
jgi:transposase